MSRGHKYCSKEVQNHGDSQNGWYEEVTTTHQWNREYGKCGSELGPDD